MPGPPRRPGSPLGWLSVWLAAGLLGHIQFCSAQDDEFEWFRCDSCTATFFKVNKVLVERTSHRKGKLPEWEFNEVLENICNDMFTKDEFGVKQYEGKKYLFGPGVTDHIPDKGFGQMGMGDYDKRLSGYCRMFIEDVGEEELQRRFAQDRAINPTELCREECASSASGSGPRLTGRAKKKKRSAPPRPPPEKRPRRKSQKQKKPPQPPASAPATSPPASPPAEDASPKGGSLDGALRLLPELSPLQLRWLGEAVLQELARRAETPAATSAAKGVAAEKREL